MPADSRRVSGPENTLQYYLYSNQKKTYEECEKELTSSNNLRKDGRKLDSSRRIFYTKLKTLLQPQELFNSGSVNQKPQAVAGVAVEKLVVGSHEVRRVMQDIIFNNIWRPYFSNPLHVNFGISCTCFGMMATIDQGGVSRIHHGSKLTVEIIYHVEEVKGAQGTYARSNIKTGVVSQAKGSAYIEMRNTKVICSVFDPREIPNKSEFSIKGELYCEFKFANFACKKRRNFIRDPEEKELSVSLRRALEPAVCLHEFPNFQVDVYCLVLQDDGGALSAAVNCAGLALADASVPMYDLVTAASLAVHGERSLLDPTAEEENVCGAVRPKDRGDRGLVTLAYLGNLKQVTELCQSGTMSVERVIEAVDVLEKQALQVYPVVQRCLVESVRKHNSRVAANLVDTGTAHSSDQ